MTWSNSYKLGLGKVRSPQETNDLVLSKINPNSWQIEQSLYRQGKGWEGPRKLQDQMQKCPKMVNARRHKKNKNLEISDIQHPIWILDMCFFSNSEWSQFLFALSLCAFTIFGHFCIWYSPNNKRLHSTFLSYHFGIPNLKQKCDHFFCFQHQNNVYERPFLLFQK